MISNVALTADPSGDRRPGRSGGNSPTKGWRALVGLFPVQRVVVDMTDSDRRALVAVRVRKPWLLRLALLRQINFPV